MILLSVNQVVKRFGPDPVLDGVTFDIRTGEHVGLVGPNGAGKTTLIDIIRGVQEPDGGHVERREKMVVGMIAQHPSADDQTVWEVAQEAMSGILERIAESERIAAEMAETTDPQQLKTLGARFDRLHHEIESRGGFETDHLIAEVLHGLGFEDKSFRQPMHQLSGGQVRRVMLAKLLLEQPDLMLLDEPSNHLDIASTQWLEDYLIKTPSAFLIVSHDRYLLDRVTERTLELVHANTESYPGNFSKYLLLKEERLAIERKTYDRQQAEIEKLEDFVRRHHHGQKHAQAEDRRKKLERIELVKLPREIYTPPMGFHCVTRTGDIVLRAEKLSKSYDQTLFENLTFDILRGERWAIVGPNGCGKTTLLRCLLGHESLDSGRVVLGANVKPGYFDQQLAFADETMPAVEAIRPNHKEFFEQQRRDLLARFGITGDMVFQPISSLSGGERNRVTLAALSASDANFLILDEPTNHLDLWARAALEKAILAYEGTVLFVSHDRYFINRVADHIIYCEPDRFRVIDGNYETLQYQLKQEQRWLQEQQAASPGPAASQNGKGARNKAKKERPKRKFPFRKLEEIESDIHEREFRIEEIHLQLTQPEVLRDGDRVKSLQSELESIQESLKQLYAHWEETTELS